MLTVVKCTERKSIAKTIENRLLDNTAVLQMLDNDSLEKLRSHSPVPHTFGIHHNDGTSSTNAETRRLSALYPAGTKEEILTLEQ